MDERTRGKNTTVHRSRENSEGKWRGGPDHARWSIRHIPRRAPSGGRAAQGLDSCSRRGRRAYGQVRVWSRWASRAGTPPDRGRRCGGCGGAGDEEERSEDAEGRVRSHEGAGGWGDGDGDPDTRERWTFQFVGPKAHRRGSGVSDRLRTESVRSRSESVRSKTESVRSRSESDRSKTESDRSKVESVRSRVESDRSRTESDRSGTESDRSSSPSPSAPSHA